jgi:hypothetical protein
MVRLGRFGLPAAAVPAAIALLILPFEAAAAQSVVNFWRSVDRPVLFLCRSVDFAI